MTDQRSLTIDSNASGNAMLHDLGGAALNTSSVEGLELGAASIQ